MSHRKIHLSILMVLPIALAGCNATSNSTAAATAASTPSSGITTTITPALIASNNTSATFMTTPANDASFAGLINGVRATAGVGNLTYNAQLDEAAQAHSTDMVVNNYFSHTGLNGSSIGDRIRATGYVPTSWGENIARGQQSENEVLTAWQNSPGHKANNERASFTEFGLGVAGTGSNVTWTLVFGSQ